MNRLDGLRKKAGLDCEAALPIFQATYETRTPAKELLCNILAKLGLRESTWRRGFELTNLNSVSSEPLRHSDRTIGQPVTPVAAIPAASTKKGIAHSVEVGEFLRKEELEYLQNFLALGGAERIKQIHDLYSSLGAGCHARSFRRTTAIFARQTAEKLGEPLHAEYHSKVCRVQGWKPPKPGLAASTFLRYSKDWQLHSGVLSLGREWCVSIFGRVPASGAASPALPAPKKPNARAKAKARGKPAAKAVAAAAKPVAAAKHKSTATAKSAPRPKGAAKAAGKSSAATRKSGSKRVR